MDMLTGVSLIGAQMWRHVFGYYISAEMLFKPMQVDGVIWKVGVNKDASEVMSKKSGANYLIVSPVSCPLNLGQVTQPLCTGGSW